MAIEIIYEDDAILVVNKPAGIVVHPAPGYETGTLVDELLKICPEMRGVGSRGHDGVVHRLDRDTGGVMVFAKTREAYLALRKTFESHVKVEKTYLAVTRGAPRPPKGTIENFLAKRGSKMAVAAEGQLAVTHYEVLGRHGGRALVEFKIETGRMHQIRVHAASLGTPVVGDVIYGGAPKGSRLLLHAVELAFPHPSTGRRVVFAAPPPPEIVYA